ncbi:hypothetical protein FisN_28Hh064 [Fistulifera solaris]|uniref:HMG box domain-containing protein n=1 Tax=Fistulifera solaris TaxID=1519565 RepID=A0A1Z5KH17_FISSO|nr:hypothetical protein FisN_28Hh064 [Fistulifera solaris]|eukprot:GAX25593.1 hypothetical protein FisN_28Hh064 [Fistulifera solaris]
MNSTTNRSVPPSLQMNMDQIINSPDSDGSKERLVVRHSSNDAIVAARPFNCQDISLPLADEKVSPKRKRKSPAVPWKKPKDMPKRPLSAYNLFFKNQRERLISEGLGFEVLAKTIAEKWKTLDDDVKAPFLRQAEEEKKVYESAVAKWRAEQQLKKAKEMQERIVEAPPLPETTRSDEPYPANWFQAGNHPVASAAEEIPPSYQYYEALQAQQQTNVSPHSVPQIINYPPGYFSAASYPQAVTSFSPFEQIPAPPTYYGDIHSIQQQEQIRLHNYILASQSAAGMPPRTDHRRAHMEFHNDQFALPRNSPLVNAVATAAGSAVHPDAASSSRPQNPLELEDWRTLRRTLDDDAVEFLKSMRFE